MAKITAASYIEGISGKVCKHSQDEFRTNSCSGTIVLSKKCNPYTGDPSEKQSAQRNVFKARVAVVKQWLSENGAQYYVATDTEVTGGTKQVGDLKQAATDLYQEALQIKKTEHLSNIQAALFLYQSKKDPYTITLPSQGGQRGGGDNAENSGI